MNQFYTVLVPFLKARVHRAAVEIEELGFRLSCRIDVGDPPVFRTLGAGDWIEKVLAETRGKIFVGSGKFFL